MKLKIGYRTFRVIPAPPTADEIRWGCFNPATQVIEVSQKLSAAEQGRTLIHELLHAAFDLSGLENDDEEKIVGHLDRAVATIIRDNKGLAGAIERALRGGERIV